MSLRIGKQNITKCKQKNGVYISSVEIMAVTGSYKLCQYLFCN
jgi:hypothetical protein